MKFSFTWLKELVDFDLSPEELADLLLSIGFEVDSITYRAELNDAILDVSVHPNRQDCLGHLGLAREIFVKIPESRLKIPETCEFLDKFEKVDIQIESYEQCKRYIGVVIDLDMSTAFPKDKYRAIQKRLECLGLNSVNPLVDIANYVMVEIGHSTHIFDFDRIKRGIIVRNARKGESVYAFDGKKYQLDETDLIIADYEKPLAIAGIIGGIDSGVNEHTKRILIESAVFNNISIRKTSKRLKLITEASYRFERGSNFWACEFSAKRVAKLITDFFNGKIKAISDKYTELHSVSIMLDSEKMDSLLGVHYSDDKLKCIIKRIGCELCETPEGTIIKPPPYRADIQNIADIAEEVSRFSGYDTIPPLFKFSSFSTLKEKSVDEWKVRSFLISQGLNEVLNYGLISPESNNFKSCGETISLVNPISKEFSVLRNSILPELLKNYYTNINHAGEIRLFEIGKIFYKSGSETQEQLVAGILLGYGKGLLPGEDKTKINLASLFSIVKGVLKEYGINNVEIVANRTATFPSFHIRVNDELAASTFIFRPEDIPNNIYLAEIYLQVLQKFQNVQKIYKEIPKYPSVKRDLCIVVDEETDPQKVQKIISDIPKECAPFTEVTAKLYDIYKDAKIGKGKKSLTFHLEFYSYERTIKDEEVNEIMRFIINKLWEIVKAELRR